MYPQNEMASSERDLRFRCQDINRRSFQRRLRYFKDSLDTCYYVHVRSYAVADGNRIRVTTPITTAHLCALEDYFWLQMTSSEKFYGLGKFTDQYVFFSFHYDSLEVPKLKVIFSASREELIRTCMSEKVYKRYVKDTDTC